MDAKTKLTESVPDLEQQPPTAAYHRPSGCCCDREQARAACTSPTAARTLAMVTVTAGLAFAVDLAARGKHAVLAAFAAAFLILCAFSSLFAWCVASRKADSGRQQEKQLRAWPGTAAARVLLWSFAAALVVAMTSWASLTAPRTAGFALSALGNAVGVVCFLEIAPFGFRLRK